MDDQSTPRNEQTCDRRAAYALFRLFLGLNILLHGAVRIPHLAGFANGMTVQFQGTALPGFMVKAFALVLPFAEGLVGLLVLLGWRTRAALIAGGLIMVFLVTGTAIRSDWQTAGLQLLYALVYYLLLRNRCDNGFSLDAWLARRRV